ncbi:MAG: TonB-dependent receptor, partial [Sphingobacteriaceae bacterium]
MRLLTRCVLSFVMVTMFGYCYAQTDSTGIEGKVVTEWAAPVEAATIRLLSHPDSVLISSTISDVNGVFRFSKIKPGNYFISVSKVGYKRLYSVKYQVLANNHIKTDAVKLIPLTHQLQEVKILAKKDYVEVRPDKTIINVDASIVSAGSNMLDVLGNSPGVRVSGNEILFKGGQKALIAINGKPVQLASEQVAELLRNYQSNQVSQVELIENPSARWDASGGGVINIILKKDQNLGWRVNITESAAIGQNYRLNSSTSANYRSKHINLFATYNVGRNELARSWDIYRNINTNAGIEGYDVNYGSKTRTSTHAFTAGGEFSLKPNQNIGALVQGNINPTGISKSNNTYLKTNGTLDSSIVTGSFIDRDVQTLNYNLNYRGLFGKFKEH